MASVYAMIESDERENSFVEYEDENERNESQEEKSLLKPVFSPTDDLGTFLFDTNKHYEPIINKSDVVGFWKTLVLDCKAFTAETLRVCNGLKECKTHRHVAILKLVQSLHRSLLSILHEASNVDTSGSGLAAMRISTLWTKVACDLFTLDDGNYDYQSQKTSIDLTLFRKNPFLAVSRGFLLNTSEVFCNLPVFDEFDIDEKHKYDVVRRLSEVFPHSIPIESDEQCVICQEGFTEDNEGAWFQRKCRYDCYGKKCTCKTYIHFKCAISQLYNSTTHVEEGDTASPKKLNYAKCAICKGQFCAMDITIVSYVQKTKQKRKKRKTKK